MDFTFKIYQNLLEAFKNKKYRFLTMEEYSLFSISESKASFKDSSSSLVILRHDIDRLPNNALKMAQLEYELDVKATYYFRIGNNIFNKKIIKQIINYGHELGYHYENMDHRQGNFQAAYRDFCHNLKQFRKLYPVRTICMHGSPLSKWDNRDLWNKYEYQDLGIIGEPYFDIDFNKVLYLTDTGRRWDGEQFAVRDKVPDNARLKNQNAKLQIRTTMDLIEATKKDILPDRVMLTVHPQRWTDNYILWLKELLMQNFKNIFKRYLNTL